MINKAAVNFPNIRVRLRLITMGLMYREIFVPFLFLRGLIKTHVVLDEWLQLKTKTEIYKLLKDAY
jgi:hypothetical protein